MLAGMSRPRKATKRPRQCSHRKCPSRSAATFATRSSWPHIVSAGFAPKGGQRDVRAAPPGVHHRQGRVEALSPAPRKGRDLGLETTGRRQRVAASASASARAAQHHSFIVYRCSMRARRGGVVLASRRAWVCVVRSGDALHTAENKSRHMHTCSMGNNTYIYIYIYGIRIRHTAYGIHTLYGIRVQYIEKSSPLPRSTLPGAE